MAMDYDDPSLSLESIMRFYSELYRSFKYEETCSFESVGFAQDS